MVLVSSCDYGQEFPTVSTGPQNEVKFNGSKFNSVSQFAVEFDKWVNQQAQKETSPIIEFRPNPESTMELVNKIKDRIKKHHDIVRVSIDNKDGSKSLVKYPPQIKKREFENFNIIGSRNVLSLFISNNGVFKDSINGEIIQVDDIQPFVLDYILSDGTDPNLPQPSSYTIPNLGKFDAAGRLIVLLKSSPDVPFKNYQQLKWEINAAYKNARNLKSLEIFNRTYEQLEKQDKETIQKIIPIVLSETP